MLSKQVFKFVFNTNRYLPSANSNKSIEFIIPTKISSYSISVKYLFNASVLVKF